MGLFPRNLLWVISITLGSTLLAATGCGSEATSGSSPGEVDNGFESDDPSGQTASSRGGSSSSSGSADSAGAAPSAEGKAEDASRAIEEADIIKVDGNRLYALSKFGGLAIIDITNPDHMTMLGRKRIEGQPFEMYVQGNKAFVMLNDFGRYVREGFYGSWIQSSEILAFDIANPSNIVELSHFDVPGTISDSRLVGDVAYVVTYEGGGCWGCQRSPATVVTSFSMAGAITKSDQLVYTAPTEGYAGWQRSVSATNQRLYIGGPVWTWNGGTNDRSIIQVVDISDPTGKLVKGADVPVAGQINSRWQMDEYAGVLRVVSQGWSTTINPKVQTFTVASSSQITPLGQTDLVLPKPESLRSVRFDGTRGYAITAERRDPLFTIDLSTPATPKQVGALEMPGWVFHMEPRGDRLIGIGYADATSSTLAVSLFDVTNLAAPALLKRVTFGSGFSQLAEDQDRIHKSVRVLDDQGMILVPFASYGRFWDNQCEPGKSGIQLIDYGKNELALKGIAPQYGLPRRAFVANGRLIAMSDRNVSSFDITSRDAPVKTGELDLSNPAYRLAALPNHIASVTSDWWTGEAMLSLTPKANADDADLVGKVSLASLAPSTAQTCSGTSGWTSWYEARVFANGPTNVLVSVPVYTYDQSTQSGRLIVASIDVSNPTKPTIVGKAELKFADLDRSKGYWGWYGGAFWDGYGFYSYWGGGSGSLVGSGQAIVQHGTKLAYIEVQFEPVENKLADGTTRYSSLVHRRLHVVDFANPAAPIVATPIELPKSLGSSPLHLYKGTVLTSRWVQSPTNPDKVRFYMDRVDLNGASPVVLASVNTPGSLLLVDEPSSRIVTTDYRATRKPAAGWESCYDLLGWRAFYDSYAKACISVDRDFKLADIADTRVTLRQTMTPPSQNISGVQIADDRIYVTRYKRYDYRSAPVYSNGTYVQPAVIEDGGLWALGGIRAGKLEIVSQMVGDAEWPLAASGTKVALYTQGGLAVWDTASPSPTLVTEANLRGWGYASHVLLDQDHAIASLGEWGLQTIKF